MGGYLIKLIRPKKTKKQQREQISQLPIICINLIILSVDKRINDVYSIHFKILLKIKNDGEISCELNNQLKLDEHCIGKILKLEHLCDYKIWVKSLWSSNILEKKYNQILN